MFVGRIEPSRGLCVWDRCSKLLKCTIVRISFVTQAKEILPKEQLCYYVPDRKVWLVRDLHHYVWCSSDTSWSVDRDSKSGPPDGEWSSWRSPRRRCCARCPSWPSQYHLIRPGCRGHRGSVRQSCWRSRRPENGLSKWRYTIYNQIIYFWRIYNDLKE